MDKNSNRSVQRTASPLVLPVVLNALAGYVVLWCGGFVNHRFEALGAGFQLLGLLLLVGVVKGVGYLTYIILAESCALIGLTVYFITIFPKINFGHPSYRLPPPTLEDYLVAAAYGAVPLLVFVLSAFLALKSTRTHQ